MLAILLRNPFVTGGRRSPVTFLRLLHHEPISKAYPSSPFSTESGLAVSFLKTSCGLSPADGLAAAAKINMKSTANAESVLRLLQTYGFTKSSISLIAAKRPAFFSTHRRKCVKPKLDLFLDAGFTGNIIQAFFSKDPSIFSCSLERLNTNLHLLMTTLGGDKKAVATSIVRGAWILTCNIKTNILPNIEILREHGVTGANIAKLVAWWPRAITQEPNRFRKTVALLENMGFDPSKTLFIQGVQVNVGLTALAWERKMQLYHSLGWSQEETLSAFKKFPNIMLVSEEKVRKIATFFVENLKWEPSRLASVPIVLSYSFEKRIVPRYDVFNILSISGLSHVNMSFPPFLYMRESEFLRRYVFKYGEKGPELLEAYKVKLDMAVAVPSNFVV